MPLAYLISNFNFFLGGGLFGGNIAPPAPKGLGPHNPTKKLAHVKVLLGHLLSQNRVPKLSDPGPPLFSFIFSSDRGTVVIELLLNSLFTCYHTVSHSSQGSYYIVTKPVPTFNYDYFYFSIFSFLKNYTVISKIGKTL